MNSTERLPFSQWASIHGTEKIISVEPLSGYRVAYREDEGYVLYLAPNARPTTLSDERSWRH